MKGFVYFSLNIILIFLLASCSIGQTSTDQEQARTTLIDFLQSLHDGEYDQAVQLYGGAYDVMRDHNSSINPDDLPALLESACTINGALCLQVKDATLEKKVSDDEFYFKVEFLNEDGSQFVLGPCCGATEEEMPSQSDFYFTVLKNGDGNFVVMDMPPYAP